MDFQIKLEGRGMMLQHNGRLANPLDPWTRALKALTGKRRKTDDDLVQIMRTEVRGACWETDDHLLGISNGAVWSCIYEAAKAFKRGEDIKRGLAMDDSTVPCLIKGEPVKCDDHVNKIENVDYRPVKIQRAKTMRARPIVRDWSSVHSLTLLDDVWDIRDLIPILERAGHLVGLAEMRPRMGTFDVVILE